MAKRAKPAAKRSRSIAKAPKVGAGELQTLLDFVRYAVSRFAEAQLVFAHGTTDPVAEAAFLACETLHLHPDQFEQFAQARVTAAEGRKILDLIERRISTRKPAAYLLNKIYMRGLPFYVDERTIVPRSFIGELLDSHFGDDEDATSLIGDPADVESVLDLCTGSGCLAILAARHFPNAAIDAVDISKDALAVAARNVSDHGLDERITLHRGDLFAPLTATALRPDHLQPALCRCRGHGAPAAPNAAPNPHSPSTAAPTGSTSSGGSLAEAKSHLAPQGGLLCEIGRGRDNLEAAFPQLPLLWLDTEDSEGEVFWIAASDL